MADDRTIIRRPTQTETGRAQAAGCLMVLSGSAIGRMFRFGENEELLLGRADDAGIRLEDDGTSRRHATIRRDPDGSLVLTDLGSTNGTFVNGTRVQMHVLRDGDRIQLGTASILKFSVQDSLEQQFTEQLYESATRDALTGAYNKRYFEEQLTQHFSYSQRHAGQLSVLLFDLDHFKRVNDTFGHIAGDSVLRKVGTEVARALRTEDLFCRVGGEEFAVLLRETAAQKAWVLGERLRSVIELSVFETEKHERIPVTISVGVASFDETRHRRPEALVEEADRNLYEAKRSGRNRVCSGAGPAMKRAAGT